MAQLGADGGHHAGLILAGIREEINAIDSQIITLLARRARISQQAQQTRLDQGMPRLDLARERAIHARYRDQLGPAGVDLADSVLRLCRGTVTTGAGGSGRA